MNYSYSIFDLYKTLGIMIVEYKKIKEMKGHEVLVNGELFMFVTGSIKNAQKEFQLELDKQS